MIRRIISLIAAVVTLVTGIRVLASGCSRISFSRAGPRGSALAGCATGNEGLPTWLAGTGIGVLGIALLALALWPKRAPQRPNQLSVVRRPSDRPTSESPVTHMLNDAIVEKAIEFARSRGLSPAQVEGAEQARRADERVVAYCYSETPESFLAVFGRNSVTKFAGSLNWSKLQRAESDAYGTAPDGTVRMVRLGRTVFEGLRPAAAAADLVKVLGLTESDGLTKTCSLVENKVWMSADEPLTSSDSATRSVDELATRLQKAADLFERGVISEAEYVELRQLILGDV